MSEQIKKYEELKNTALAFEEFKEKGIEKIEIVSLKTYGWDYKRDIEKMILNFLKLKENNELLCFFLQKEINQKLDEAKKNAQKEIEILMK